jgi:ankyrin repeat protein
MKGINLFLLCFDEEWSEVREYLSSDAAEEQKKSNTMYRNDCGWTCLHAACYYGAPDDIAEAMLDIGGKESVMEVDIYDDTALHSACHSGASYNIIKMLIEVGGKNLVMAKSMDDNAALHSLCLYIKKHTKVAEKVKLILEVGDANLLLSARNYHLAGKTPLEIATDNGASNIIKELLTVQSNSNSNSTRNNDSPSASIVPADSSTPVTQSSQEQDTTQSSSTNNDLTIPIRGLDIDKHYQSQLREAKENTEKLQLDSALAMLKEELYQCKKSQEAEISRLAEQKEKGEKDNKYWKEKADNYMQICSEYKAKLQEMKDKASAPVADIQMIKQEEGEAAHANELEESNRRAADLEATVETQRLEIADLSSEKDGIEKSLKDEVDKLTRELSKQQAELQLLKNSSSDVVVGMKRKHTIEEHERGRRRHNSSGTVSNTIIKKEES